MQPHVDGLVNRKTDAFWITSRIRRCIGSTGPCYTVSKQELVGNDNNRNPINGVDTARGSGGTSNGVRMHSTRRGQQPSPPRENIDERANSGQTPPVPLAHQCPECARSFTTKTGLGVHRRRAHPITTNDEIVTDRVKARWSAEEISLMAMEEARLVVAGTTNVNDTLKRSRPERTLEAVKGRRKNAAYKLLVAEYVSSLGVELVEEVTVTAVDPTSPTVVRQETTTIQDLRLHIRGCIDVATGTRGGSVARARCIAERALAGENVMDDITQWMTTTFSNVSRPKGPSLGNARQYTGNSNQRRKARYARLQQAFQKNQRDAARMVLQDTDTTNIVLPNTADMLGYWHDTLSTCNTPESVQAQFPSPSPGLKNLWRPISMDEIRSVRVSRNSACGLDGVTARAWSRVNPKAKELLFNTILLAGELPVALRRSRTVFLPKKKGGSNNPSEFRPISINSVLTRHLHKILARRMTVTYNHDHRQSAYQHLDGVGRSLALMTSVLDISWREQRELHVASLDAAKAFNSVTFDAIFSTLRSIGCEPHFVSYIERLYTDVETLLQHEGAERVARVGQGVLQGDPLSGPIFMAVYECAIQCLDKNIGFRHNEKPLNALAYADDIVLLASTRRGLQTNLERFEAGLEPLGLKLNASKSLTLSLVPSGRDKKMKVDTSHSFKVAGDAIRPKGLDEVWTYLGMNFEGKTVEAFDGKLSVGLEKISLSPLKPQQRVALLKSFVIPAVLHKLVMGTSTAAALRSADITLRSHVRSWLHLAKDVPVAFFHAAEKVGGLGLPCLQHIVPLHRYNRYHRIAVNIDDQLASIRDCAHMRNTLHRAKMALSFLGEEPSSALLRDYWRKRLWESVDGSELELVPNHKSSYDWCTTLRHGMSGEDYVHGMHLRINSVPSRDRTTRGRKHQANVATRCRAGCPVPETTYHCIQRCFRTKAMRMDRHNRVVDLLEAELQHRGFAVTKEKRVVGAEGDYSRPDLIAVRDNTAYIVDAQVVMGQNVELAHENKARKYRDLRGFEHSVRGQHGVLEIVHMPCTITWRGLWSSKSAADLAAIGVSVAFMHRAVTSVLRGSWLCWRLFNRITTMRPRRVAL